MEINKNIRQRRKNAHLKYAAKQIQGKGTWFDKIHLVNNSIPELNYSAIDTHVNFLNRRIPFPLMINAMTGGTLKGYEYNKALAQVATYFDIPIAVGSQKIAITDPDSIESFSIVRKINRNGIVIGNLSAMESCSNIQSAIEILEADALQLHLNVPQELCMKEGDRDFIGVIDNIQRVISSTKIPIIIKETGFGLSYDVVKVLTEIGVEYFDVGGFGGTNFVKIENARKKRKNQLTFLDNWGIPTAISVYECRNASPHSWIVSSGGISDGGDIIKSIRLGANMVGITGSLLKVGRFNYTHKCINYINNLMDQTKMLMLLTGAGNVEEIRRIPIYCEEVFKSRIGEGHSNC